MAGDFYVFEPRVGVGVVVIGLDGDQFGGDGIARRDLAQHGGRFHPISHCHGIHKAGDGVAIDDRGPILNVDGQDAAGEGITFCSSSFSAMAGSKKKCAGQDEGDRDDTKSTVAHVLLL